MKTLVEKITNVISVESSNSLEEQKLKEFEKMISDMKKSGLIKRPVYDLPLVDTIGKTYYSSINKHR